MNAPQADADSAGCVPPRHFWQMHETSAQPAVWLSALTLAGMVGIFLIVALGAGGALVAWVMLDDNPATQIDLNTGQFQGVDSRLVLLSAIAPFLVAWPMLWLAARVVHGRPFRSVLTAAPAIRWGRGWAYGGVWALLLTGACAVEAWMYPGRYSLSDSAAWLSILPFALVLVAAQASIEEIFFRGWLMQLLRHWFGRAWIAGLLSTVVFGTLHFANPEVSAGFYWLAAYYIGFGAVLTWIAHADNGAEGVVGIHVANNLFTACIANYKVSALPVTAMFTIEALDPPVVVTGSVITTVLFLIIRACAKPLLEPAADSLSEPPASLTSDSTPNPTDVA